MSGEPLVGIYEPSRVGCLHDQRSQGRGIEQPCFVPVRPCHYGRSSPVGIVFTRDDLVKNLLCIFLLLFYFLGQCQNAGPHRRSPHLPPDPKTSTIKMRIRILASGWLNAGLFLFVTGIRLWTHVVERLTLRISHLHDIIHYPSPGDLRQQLTDLKQQMEKKEHTLGKVRWRMDVGAEAMYEYVDEAGEVVERACGGMRRSVRSRIRG
ncbi:hypothetical protein EDD18DRAFT_1113504 [Armillaria luteobubalina]|uniref:Uncharacterized protein n=1 Tax=Armillaria luteobubalina TaxID=153913 RepID=A0AA39U8U1_9AGAR|nr:hypothetical protein EDD18DRAFT_1113504 [Armillaria luteobubalina]